MSQPVRDRRPGRPATRKDVAQRAGVSTATVSYVLNRSQKLPRETVERVLKAAADLDYRPNFTVRSLVTRETRQIAIVLNNLANPICADLIRGFENEAISRGYFVAICTGYQNIDDYFGNFALRRIDGLFIEAPPFKYHMEKLQELVDASIRVVVFGNTSLDGRLVSHIETDYYAAIGARAFDMLYNDITTGVKGYVKNRAELIDRLSAGPARRAGLSGSGPPA